MQGFILQFLFPTIFIKSVIEMKKTAENINNVRHTFLIWMGLSENFSDVASFSLKKLSRHRVRREKLADLKVQLIFLEGASW